MRIAAGGSATGAQLAERTGYSRANVSIALNRARALGLVHRESLGPRQVLFRPAAVPMKARREKVFGPGRAVPLDRNAKARIAAYAQRLERPEQAAAPAQGADHPRPSWRSWRRCCGASTTAGPVSASRRYEAIAAKAECCRCTVAEALKALEWAGVLTWQNRITRAVVRQRDLFGRWSNRWTVIRTSNAYVFTRPESGGSSAGFRAKSENPTGTPNQDISRYLRPVLRERIEAQSIADMDRDAVASRDRQLAGAESHHGLRPERQIEGRKALMNKRRLGECAP